MKIIAVVPCYRSAQIAPNVVRDIINYVDFVICVDDLCPDNTGLIIQNQVKSDKVKVIFHNQNKGVGGATKIGFYWLLEKDCDIIIKIDADNQMNPADIPVHEAMKEEQDENFQVGLSWINTPASKKQYGFPHGTRPCARSGRGRVACAGRPRNFRWSYVLERAGSPS